MILVDTSVWAYHIRTTESILHSLLESGKVLCHPFVIGELAMGHLKQREVTLSDLAGLPRVVVASDEEVLLFINEHRVFGTGISYIDAHLLVAAQLTDEAVFWTYDKRLHAAAETLGIAWRGSRLQ